MIARIFSRAAGILVHPVETFRDAKEDTQGFVFLYILLVNLLAAVLGIIATAAGFRTFIGDTPYYLIFNLIAGPFISIIATLVIASMLHLFVYLAGGKKPLNSTIIATAYSSTPAALLGWLWGIGPVFILWSLALTVIGIREMQEIPTLKAIIAVAGATIVLVLLFVLIYLPQAFFRF